MGSLLIFKQKLRILSLSMCELLSVKVMKWFSPICALKIVPMCWEWNDIFKYVSISSHNAAVFKLFLMENRSGTRCTHPQTSVDVQNYHSPGMRMSEKRRMRRGKDSQRFEWRKKLGMLLGPVAEWAESFSLARMIGVRILRETTLFGINNLTK